MVFWNFEKISWFEKTLKKRYFEKVKIFHKVWSKVFGVVESESISSFLKFWKIFLVPDSPMAALRTTNSSTNNASLRSFWIKKFFQNFKKPLIDSDSATPKTLIKLYGTSLLSQNNAFLRFFRTKKFFQNFKKPLIDSDSTTPKTFDQTLWNIIIFSK